jgi:hypothetical protein
VSRAFSLPFSSFLAVGWASGENCAQLLHHCIGRDIEWRPVEVDIRALTHTADLNAEAIEDRELGRRSFRLNSAAILMMRRA